MNYYNQLWEKHEARLLGVILFLNGAVIMSVEMIGSRTIAPFFGASVYVWTAIIGVILASIATGYWYGGKLADRSASRATLQKVMFASCVLLALTAILQKPVLQGIADAVPGLRLQSAVASLVLFAPPTFFMGMVSPMVAKLSLRKMSNSGEVVGRLYAIGTFGSIFGTFITGYWLISAIGTRAIYWLCTAVLTILALSLSDPRRKEVGLSVLLIVLLGALGISPIQKTGEGVVYEKDTAYSYYQVVDEYWDGRPTRLLITDDRSAQSGIPLDGSDEYALGYTKSIMEIVESSRPSYGSILVIGGGAFILPQILQDKYPDARIDVAEIDPQLRGIAETYFSYAPNEKTTIYHEDGRTLINRNERNYDLIIVDAFTSLRPPFHLLSLEAFEKMNTSLLDNGLVIGNVISGSIKGRNTFTASLDLTMRQVFQHVESYVPEEYVDISEPIMNLTMVASNTELIEPVYQNTVRAVSADSFVFTDDYTPTDRLLGEL
jgi:spermidine synthase